MAEDFASLPATGILPVICGDAHLGNFGFYASPERDLVFDLNDFDEAHPGPWEWDCGGSSRASGWRGGRTARRRRSCDDAVVCCVRRLPRQIAHLAEQPLLERAFERVDLDRLRRRRRTGPCERTRSSGSCDRARRETSDRALPRLTDGERDGVRRIVEDPPVVITRPDDEQNERLLDGPRRRTCDTVSAQWRGCSAATVVVDVAHKVVGVGRSGCAPTSRCCRAAARTTCSSSS